MLCLYCKRHLKKPLKFTLKFSFLCIDTVKSPKNHLNQSLYTFDFNATTCCRYFTNLALFGRVPTSITLQ